MADFAVCYILCPTFLRKRIYEGRMSNGARERKRERKREKGRMKERNRERETDIYYINETTFRLLHTEIYHDTPNHHRITTTTSLLFTCENRFVSRVKVTK